MILPVNNAEVTSPYGDGYLNGKKRFHKGIDFVDSNRKNFSVFAVADGVCIYDMDNYDEFLRWSNSTHSAGNMIVLVHSFGGIKCYIRYLHLLVNKVSKNQVVAEGDYLGLYGDVGYSFGAHLHIDAWDMDWKGLNIEEIFKGQGLLV